jgi:hypothetical protein
MPMNLSAASRGAKLCGWTIYSTGRPNSTFFDIAIINLSSTTSSLPSVTQEKNGFWYQG